MSDSLKRKKVLYVWLALSLVMSGCDTDSGFTHWETMMEEDRRQLEAELDAEFPRRFTEEVKREEEQLRNRADERRSREEAKKRETEQEIRRIEETRLREKRMNDLARGMGEQLMEAIGGGQGLVVRVETWDYFPDTDEYRIKLDVRFNGKFDRSNQYQIKGTLRVSFSGKNPRFSREYANPNYRSMEIGRPAASGLLDLFLENYK